MEKLTKVQFSNLDKVLYPAAGVRKLDIVKYYITVAPRMLPFLEGRALVVTRYPDGVEAEGFYGKDAPQGTPDWVPPPPHLLRGGGEGARLHSLRRPRHTHLARQPRRP